MLLRGATEVRLEEFRYGPLLTHRFRLPTEFNVSNITCTCMCICVCEKAWLHKAIAIINIELEHYMKLDGSMALR